MLMVTTNQQYKSKGWNLTKLKSQIQQGLLKINLIVNISKSNLISKLLCNLQDFQMKDSYIG